jgi:hypothetical protein
MGKKWEIGGGLASGGAKEFADGKMRLATFRTEHLGVEAVDVVAEFGDLAVDEEDFHHIKAIGDRRVIDLPKILRGGADERAAFAIVHGAAGAGPTADSAGFDFNKDEGIAVAKDQVDLAVFAGEIGGEELEAVMFEVTAGSVFTEDAVLQVAGLVALPKL